MTTAFSLCRYSQSIVNESHENSEGLRGLLGWRIKKLLNVRFFWDYYILGWGEPMA